MANEWIRARAGLDTDPRFLTLYADLLYGPNPYGLLRYVVVCLEPSYPTPRDAVLAASRFVTDAALRDVTRVTLLRTWHAVNAHCKVEGNDAVMRPMTLADLDRVTLIDGFAASMEVAGWLVRQTPNSLVFPNFCEFNDPACVRGGPAKSDAERAREYRLRKKEKDAAEAVTNVTKRHGREEKRREENTPKAPTKEPRAITDPKEAAALVLPEEGRWMPCDHPHLDGPARLVVREYDRLVKSAYRATGNAIAAVVKILAHGVSEDLLLEAARRYGADQDRQDIGPKARQGAGAFYGKDGWRAALGEAAEAKAAPVAAPPPRRKPTDEERAAMAAALAKARQGRPQQEGKGDA